MRIIGALIPLVLVITTTSHRMHPLSDEFINFINSKQTLWQAGRNFHRDTPLKYLKRLAGTIKDNATLSDGVGEPPRYNYTENCIPFEYDARKIWKNCTSVSDIRDQGSCVSCWAVATVSVMSDRLCIQSKGQSQVYFSELDVMSCCMFCGGACNAGGILRQAWRYGVKNGIVSGGPYNSHKGCRPYTIKPCEHNPQHQGKELPCGNDKPKTVCRKQCESGYPIDYLRDRRRLATYYKLTDVKEIMSEIYIHGPVTATFTAHEDLYSYKSGVYRYVTGKSKGYHSIKLLGWGEENGVTYWLAANSWNTDWGDKGFFKIIRGVNHLGIEDDIYAGLFRV